MSSPGKIVEATRGIFLPLFLVPFILLALFCPSPLQAVEEHPKRILVLHSYHPDFPWTAGIMAGMKETLDKSGKKVLLHAEYMDTKRYFDDPEYLSRILEEALHHKLAKGAFDLVLLSDTDALNFTIRHRHDLFAGMPIVFCGINDFHPSMIAGVGGITGVAEVPDYRETIDLALRLHPESREIVALNSTADATGRAQRESLAAEAAHLRGRIRVVPWDDLPLEEVADRLRELPRGTLVVVNTSAFNDRSGQFLEMSESMRIFRATSAVPIYSLWKPFLGLGIVGGKLVSMESQGRLAAELALRILDGESPDEIAVIGRGANEFMFDYNELERFGISRKALPEGSVVINAPPPIYTVSKQQLWIALALMSAVVLALLVNIVWRKRAEAELRTAHRRLQDIIEFLPDATFVIDRQGRVEAWNRAMEELTGVSKKEILDQGGEASARAIHGYGRLILVDLLRNPDAEIGESYDFVRKEGRALIAESFVPVARGGKGAYLWGIASPLLDQGGTPAGAIESLRDITERKQAEEALKNANRELDAFVQTVSHDLRAPLTPILGYADFLREHCRERLDPQSLDCLAEISRSANKMLALLEDLLTLATVGQIERPAEPVSAEAVVDDVQLELAEPLLRTGTLVEVGSLPTVRIPQTLLAQIFNNLIGNAVRYAGKEGSSIEVGGERLGTLVRFHVRDHGPGVPEEERGRIFDLFYRGAMHREVPGTGVGLATVQKIARRYGGRTWVEETEGGGSTFWVEMEDALDEEGKSP
jgi:PAS domain S-box-containing protein